MDEETNQPAVVRTDHPGARRALLVGGLCSVFMLVLYAAWNVPVTPRREPPIVGKLYLDCSGFRALTFFDNGVLEAQKTFVEEMDYEFLYGSRVRIRPFLGEAVFYYDQDGALFTKRSGRRWVEDTCVPEPEDDLRSEPGPPWHDLDNRSLIPAFFSLIRRNPDLTEGDH